MTPILEIQNISKKFMIHDKQQPYLSLRDQLSGIFKGAAPKQEFWALNGVSFNINQGESIGIIGKNGAGKSTLLKILSKITPPTSGKIISRGRIASLLEVGTGFHPELSGRENIFMNGSILGMRRKEILKNFDSIVDFSGVEKFIDTPLKHYSSGMQLRLAFAVAAFLENEILIIDEVLAVGDSEFQKKCLGKMESVSKSGRTILFVSHNMASLRSLCHKGKVLEKGKMIFEGDIQEAVDKYLSNTIKTTNSGQIDTNASTINTGKVKFTLIKMINHHNENILTVPYLSKILLYMELDSLYEINEPLIDVRINTFDRIELVHTMNMYSNNNKGLKKGKNSITCSIKNFLQPGKYSITIGIHEKNGFTLEYVENILDFEVLNISEDGLQDFKYNFKLGLIRFESEWKIENNI